MSFVFYCSYFLRVRLILIKRNILSPYTSKIMPLFSNKFSPKTIPVRRQVTSVLKNEFGSDYASKELSLEIPHLKLKLGEFELSYEDEQWIPASGKAGAAHKENIRLKKELEQLEEENNMLRFKFEVLLDMMTEKTVEAEQYELQRAQSLGSLKEKGRKSMITEMEAANSKKT